jgi:two-component system sensor histidine kinase AlgZ
MSDSGEKQPNLGDYFIPNLCRGHGLPEMLVAAGLIGLLITLIHSGISSFDRVFFTQVALYIVSIVLLSAVIQCQARRFLIRRSLHQVALINYLLILFAAATCAVAIELWCSYRLSEWLQIDFLWVIYTVLITAIPAGALLWMFYLQHQLRQQQDVSQKMRMESLQSKIRPHFLFNSMNSLASLIRVDPDTAEQTLENLCDLFRYAINDRAGGVSLQLEVEVCKKYLEIEKLRFAERLQYNWNIEVDLADIFVPALILQPLIENAVFHGIQPAIKGGYLQIKIYQHNQWVCIDIVNSLEADREQLVERFSGHHLAVNNLRDRLDAFFNKRAELQETVNQNHYHTRIRFKPTEG